MKAVTEGSDAWRKEVRIGHVLVSVNNTLVANRNMNSAKRLLMGAQMTLAQCVLRTPSAVVSTELLYDCQVAAKMSQTGGHACRQAFMQPASQPATNGLIWWQHEG